MPYCVHRVVAADERVQRYERVVVMALYGLSLTLQRLPKEFITERQEEWEGFVAEKRLWKLTRHHNPYVSERYIHVVVNHYDSPCVYKAGYIVWQTSYAYSLLMRANYLGTATTQGLLACLVLP